MPTSSRLTYLVKICFPVHSRRKSENILKFSILLVFCTMVWYLISVVFGKIVFLGLSKEEVKVQVEEGRVLQISGERKKEETTSTDRWHRVERSQGSFLRRFRLPENAKLEEVKAAMENGVLTVTVPKASPPEPKSAVRNIDISSD